MDHQLDLFGDEAPRSAPRAADRRRYRPAPGELGIPLTAVQVEIVDRVLADLAALESANARLLPVRVGEVLHLPRDMEIVADLMDLLDRPLADPSWRRPSDRLAQNLHEWWQGAN